MVYKNAWESICDLLPAINISVKYVKRGHGMRVRLTRETHVLIDYPYNGTLEEADYACLIAQITRMAFGT